MVEKVKRLPAKCREVASASKEAFLLFAEAIDDPLFLLQVSGEIIAANETARQQFNTAPGSLCPLVELAAAPDAFAAFLRNCAEGTPSARVLELRLPSGRRHWCRARPLRSGKDKALVLVQLLDRPPAEAVAAEAPEQADLQAALRQKDAQLRELRHRHRNNLQVLLSICGLALRNEADAHTRSRLEEMRNRVLAITFVQRLIRQQDGVATVDAATLMNDFTAELARSAAPEDVHLDVHAEPLSVSLESAGPLALIACELVGEALRSARQRQGGSVSVSLRRTNGDGVELSVVDNGPAVPPSDDPTSADPTSADPQASFARTLANGLAGQLGGTLTVQAGKGTRRVLRFDDPAAAAPGPG